MFRETPEWCCRPRPRSRTDNTVEVCDVVHGEQLDRAVDVGTARCLDGGAAALVAVVAGSIRAEPRREADVAAAARTAAAAVAARTAAAARRPSKRRRRIDRRPRAGRATSTPATATSTAATGTERQRQSQHGRAPGGAPVHASALRTWRAPLLRASPVLVSPLHALWVGRGVPPVRRVRRHGGCDRGHRQLRQHAVPLQPGRLVRAGERRLQRSSLRRSARR